jgi:alanine racemase
VSLAALRHNCRQARELVGPDVAVMAVVKADAYGHGVVACARALEEEGAEWLGVTSTEEGVLLRENGVRTRILLMTGFWRGEEDEILRHNLTPAVWDWWQVGVLEAAAERVSPGGPPFPIHLKVDTGMARLGVGPPLQAMFARRIQAARRLQLEGLFSHLASSEVLDAPDVEAQMRRFDEVECEIADAGLVPIYRHLANTGAIASRPTSWKTMVRPGISLYGYTLPFSTNGGGGGLLEAARELPVKPVLAWKTRVVGMRNVSPGQAVGYNARFVAQRPTRLAVVPVGYADGLSRQLSCRGRMIVRDRYAPIAGAVSMDVTLLDVTDVPETALGDEVTIIGATGHCSVTAWDHARLANTIPYEILCGISKRVPRQYV